MKQLIYSCLLLICVSCFPSGPTSTMEEDSQALKNTTWELVKPQDLEGTLHFSEDLTKISGNNSCNDYSADINIKNYQLEFKAFMQTEKFCEDREQEESLFMQLLSKTKDYRLSGNRLTLVGQQGTLLIFQKKSEE